MNSTNIDEIKRNIHKSLGSPIEKSLSKQDFINLYIHRNMALTVIADLLGVSVLRLQHLKIKYAIDTNPNAAVNARSKHYKGYKRKTFRNKLSPEELRIKYLIDKKSIGDIAKEYDVSRTAVHKYMKEQKIISRSNVEAHRLAAKMGKLPQQYREIDDNFFKHWSREMAWVIGFLLTDGCLHEEHFSNDRVSIYLIDLDVIKKIKTHLGSTHKIIKQKGKGVQIQYGLSFCNQSIYNDLCNLGLSPRKSLNVTMPKIPIEYFADFARGVFEGDGSYIRTNRLSIKLSSGSKGFITEFLKFMGNMGLTSRKLYTTKKDGSSTHYSIKYDSDDDCKTFYEKIYKDTPQSITMDRKRKIIEEWYNFYLMEYGKKNRIIEKQKDLTKEAYEFAKQRNGKCLSGHLKNNYLKVKWECPRGHHFIASYTMIKLNSTKDLFCPICKYL